MRMMRLTIAFSLLLLSGAVGAQQGAKNDSLHTVFEKRINDQSAKGDQANTIRQWVSYTIDRKDHYMFDKIEAACQAFLKENERMGKKDEAYAEGLISLGRIYATIGQKERALKAYTDAFEINKNLKPQSPANYLRNLKFIVALCNDSRSYTPQTESYFTLFKEEYVKQQEDPDTYLTNLMEEVRYNHHKGQPEKSIPIIDGALVYTEKRLGKNSQEYTLFRTYRAAMDGEVSKADQRAFAKAAGMNEGSAEMAEMNEYLNKGDFARATAMMSKYSGMLKNYYFNQKNYKGYVSMLNTFVLYYRETGNLNKAFDMLQEAAAVTKEYLANDNAATVEMLSTEGDFYKEMGNDQRAEAKYLEAVKILDVSRTKENEKENDEQYYDVWARLGAVYRHWGYNRDAHQNYLDVAGYMRDRFGENSAEYGKALISVADVLVALNLTGRAEWYFKKGLGILEKAVGKTSNAYISSAEQYASLLVRSGKYQEAEPHQVVARDVYRQMMGNKSGLYLATTSDLAFQYVLAGNYAKAQPLFKELIQNNLSRVQNFFPSLSENEKGVFYRRTYADVNAYNVFAYRYGATNKEEAGNMYNVQLNTKGLLFKSTNRVKETILQSKDDSLKATYNKWLESKDMLAKIYQLSPDQKKVQGINEKAWEEKVNMLERKLTRQSQLFSSLLVENPTWQSVQQKLLPGEAAIEMVKLIEPRYEYFYWKIDKGFGYDSLGSGEWGIYNIDSDRTPIHKAGARTRDVILAINGIPLKGKNGTEVEDLYKKNPIELTLKRDAGAPFKVTVKDDSVFYISMARRARYAALILTSETKTGPELVTLGNGDDLENRYGRYYQNAIKQKLDDPYSYNQFWKPIQSKLTNIKKIYFSPDGVYNFINPSTLENPTTKRYLLDEMEIAIVNNTADILISKPKGNIKKATLIGFPEYHRKNINQGKANLSSDVDYRAIKADSSSSRFMSGSAVSELPGTKTEVNGIEGLLKAGKFDVSKLMMGDATEDKVKGLHSPDILHIATHGFFMNELSAMGEGARGITGVTAQKLSENPLLRSGLLLAGAGETIAKGKDDNAREDGILTAYEAMSLDLQNTELVVLSACETGLGQVKNGEGVYGLNRAFRAAGAKSVLMSLWKVDDDATQKLMTEFYSEWLKGTDKKQAFRKAQLKLRETYSHPYYWGAFVTVGE
jgi:CHAT domain-containing protein